jgi:hypothetical protein
MLRLTHATSTRSAGSPAVNSDTPSETLPDAAEVRLLDVEGPVLPGNVAGAAPGLVRTPWARAWATSM